MGRSAPRCGAAIVALGLTLAGPTAVAAADDAGTEAAPAAPAAPSAAPADGPSRASAATRSARNGRTVAAERGTAVRDDGVRASARARGGLAGPDGAGRAPAARPESESRVAGSRDLPPRESTPEPKPAVPSSEPTTAAAPETPAAVAAAPQAPAFAAAAALRVPAAAALRVPAAALTANADILTTLFAPIQAFIEGIALLVRRTFFNEAPTVAPVQTTGQVTGPITGTIGAIDPEGDPITYSLTRNPEFGEVAIAADGTYTYTPGAGFTGTDTFAVTATDTGFHLNLLNPFRPAGTLASAVVYQGADAPRLQFVFSYAGGSQFWSNEARSSLEAAATRLATNLVVSSPVTITYTVTGQFNLLSGTLASATSDLTGTGPGYFPTVVQNKVITGVDANGAAADGEIDWNFGLAWALGNSVAGGEYDFQSVAIHELMHTLGFLSNVDQAGSNTGRSWTTFDGFVTDGDGTGAIGDDFRWNTAFNTNLTGDSDGLYFSGPSAVAAYGGLVPLYTPDPWESGSSVSHLDDFTFVRPNEQLMNAFVEKGPGIRTLSAVERAILTDLGYTVVSPVSA